MMEKLSAEVRLLGGQREADRLKAISKAQRVSVSDLFRLAVNDKYGTNLKTDQYHKKKKEIAEG